MPLHPLAERFADVAGEYERGRPDYPPAVAGALAAELQLGVGARVLDLAAGTGKLTRALLAFGLDVIAVEPQGALRELLAASVGDECVRDGLAEAIPLPDGSLAAVTVADAIHWFDHRLALAEIGRVLRDGGGLAVVTTFPDWGAASWAREVGTLLAKLRPKHPQFDGPPWQDAVRASGAWSEPREVRVVISQPVSPQRIVDHIASFSWVAALEQRERDDRLEQLRAVIATGETPPALPVQVVLGLTELAPTE
jgi:ubiquinone/menaquinone biosynthesis C-methylase UbiE